MGIAHRPRPTRRIVRRTCRTCAGRLGGDVGNEDVHATIQR